MKYCFLTLGRVIVRVCSILMEFRVVSSEPRKWKHGLCLAPCIWHLASCILQKLHLTSYILTLASYILHLTETVSYILTLASYILHLTKTVACILHLAARAQAFLPTVAVGHSVPASPICYHAFVPNILWLLVFACSCLEVWPFDQEAWLVWLSLQWCELDVIL